MKKFLLLFLCAVMISSIVFTGIGINSSVMANSLEEETDIPVVLPPTPPVSPSEVNATTVSSSEIRVVWTSSSDDTTEFIIERKQEEGSYSQITTVSSSTRQYNDSGLTPNTRYYYKIKAANKVAVSGYSSEATAITSPAPVTPPFKPTGLTATANSTSEVRLTWAKASGIVDRYEIERKTSGGNYQLINTISNGNATSYNDTGASPSTTYYYRIIAFNSGGASPYSDEVNATTQGVIVNPPAKPTKLTTIGIFSDKINLSWVDNADSEAGYKVERKTGNGNFMEIIVLGPNRTTYSDTGISPNTVYTYRVRAYNTGGNSDYSNEINGSTINFPAAPTNLIVSSTSTDRISISWQDNASNENGFRIERKVDNGNWNELTTVKANATSYTDTGLSNNRTYSYRVRAYNDAGNSGYSNEVSTKTGGVPEKPTNVKITNVSTDRISISWQDNASNENGFRIERKVDNGNW
ncbi:fibronectin type III domain-containing protein, partial [Clostridium aceticum]|uniref:fibronectin type III domain-containing protein n=1 Tax=Clostridium aceticum TaxID=84022 RepID=UPI0006974E7F